MNFQLSMTFSIEAAEKRILEGENISGAAAALVSIVSSELEMFPLNSD